MLHEILSQIKIDELIEEHGPCHIIANSTPLNLFGPKPRNVE
jgi:hypothetical protein